MNVSRVPEAIYDLSRMCVFSYPAYATFNRVDIRVRCTNEKKIALALTFE